LKGQTRDPNSLKAQYLENYLSCRLQIWCAALYGECLAGTQKISPKSGRGLGHVTFTIFGSTVGYPSDSLASCLNSCTPKVLRKIFVGSILCTVIKTPPHLECAAIHTLWNLQCGVRQLKIFTSYQYCVATLSCNATDYLLGSSEISKFRGEALASGLFHAF